MPEKGGVQVFDNASEAPARQALRDAVWPQGGVTIAALLEDFGPLPVLPAIAAAVAEVGLTEYVSSEF